MVIDIMRANESPKGKKMNSEKTMKLRAKHGKILRKPKIKRWMKEAQAPCIALKGSEKLRPLCFTSLSLSGLSTEFTKSEAV